MPSLKAIPEGCPITRSLASVLNFGLEQLEALTHWGRVTHIEPLCVSKLAIIGSENGVSPGRRQAIIWTNAGVLLIGPLGINMINFSGILSEIHTFSYKKMRLKMSSGKWWPSCLGLNVLSHWRDWHHNVSLIYGMSWIISDYIPHV